MMEITEAPQLDWSDELLIGHGGMDDTHREFVELVNVLLAAPDSDLERALEAFAQHAVEHFGEEDRLMRTTKFPPADCHIDEHAKVLESVRQVQRLLVEENDTDQVRSLARALADWFPSHVSHLDSALAAWVVKKAHGGAPLVLRRNVVHHAV